MVVLDHARTLLDRSSVPVQLALSLILTRGPASVKENILLVDA